MSNQHHHILYRWAVVVTLLACIPNVLWAQLQAEYYIDVDPGLGNATTITSPIEADGTLHIEFPTDGLSPGDHIVGIRAYATTDDDGQAITRFGPTIMQRFVVRDEIVDQQVLYAEYFFDNDPGYGKGTAIPVTPGEELNLDNLEIPTTDLEVGEHNFGIRVYGTSGWGPTIMQRFVVREEKTPQELLYAEYFFDEDPGYGKGVAIPVTPGEELNLDNLEIPTSNLEAGEHNFGIRVYGTNGWGPTIMQRFVVREEKTPQELLYAEYYFDEDPGYGNGMPIPVTPGEELNLDNLEISTTDLEAGEHNFGIRVYGTSGWGPTITQRIIVKGEIVDQEVLYAEYFFGDDPGYGQGTPISITPGQEVSIEDLELPTDNLNGICILGIRAYGTSGWGPTIVTEVMLGAGGEYTLNANAATSLANRNYKSLEDVINDFSECGVKDDVTFTITTNNTNYSLDATSNDCLAKMTQIIESFDGSDNEKVMTFTAEEGSGNSLAITTTDEGMATVVSLFSHVATSNVTLTINGVAYDFSAVATRHQESCSGTATQLVALSGISSKVNASWTAQPQAGTSISGYQTNGSGDIPAMMLENNSTQCDTLTVNVILSDDYGRTLTTYDYSYIVHANVSNQSFTKFSPADGSGIEPGTVKLRWKAIGDAIGYRVNIIQRPIDDDFADDIEEVIETDETEYEMLVEGDMLYTWTVTAIGYCDELTSEAHSFTGNGILLGDANGDDHVTVADVMITVNRVLGKNPRAFIERNADINGDSRISVADIMSIVKLVLLN